MQLPISFDEVPYFKNQFRGDLIVTAGVIYYFPHTNVAKEKLEKENRVRVPKQFELVSQAAISVIGPANFLLAIVNSVFRLYSKLTRRTVNQPRLGSWVTVSSNESAQSQLDNCIEWAKKRSSELVAYQYSLPKPMRCWTTTVSTSSNGSASPITNFVR